MFGYAQENPKKSRKNDKEKKISAGVEGHSIMYGNKVSRRGGGELVTSYLGERGGKGGRPARGGFSQHRPLKRGPVVGIELHRNIKGS